MARLKKGEKKKVQMTIRIAPEIAEKLKSIDKYSSKVGGFINDGINEVGKRQNLIKLQSYYEQKKWDYENIDIEHNDTSKCMLKGLEIALQIMNK